MPMLMLVCIGITTLTLTTATMDSPGMCLDARGVMLKLPQRLMLMPDIMDTFLIMAMEDTMATILDKQCVWRKILSDTLNSLSTTSNLTFFLKKNFSHVLVFSSIKQNLCPEKKKKKFPQKKKKKKKKKS